MEANLWDGSDGAGYHEIRPALVAYCGTHEEARAFTANFRNGRPATLDDSYKTLKLPKSSGHRWIHQRFDQHTTITIAYRAELFDLDPGASATGEIKFVFMPPDWWVNQQGQKLSEEFGTDAFQAAEAALFAAYLDRRTPYPLLNDLRFSLRLYRAALEEPWFRQANASLSGLSVRSPRICKLSASTLETFLSDISRTYFEEDLDHGTPSIGTDSWILPFPQAPVEQLCLDFGA